MKKTEYRGRLAPSPTGRLHAGHLSTFAMVFERCNKANGTLIYRDDDLDQIRCSSSLSECAMRDIRDMGIVWHEGPDCGGNYAPYSQSDRLDLYVEFFHKLLKTGKIYPCIKSRKEIKEKIKSNEYANKVESQSVKKRAIKNLDPRSRNPQDDPNISNDSRNSNTIQVANEPLFPLDFRRILDSRKIFEVPGNVNWRFEAPDKKEISFFDNRIQECSYICGQDISDFLVWRKDGFPAYELATVVDDHLMQITEVVRGEDLLMSTARQLLLYEAFGWEPPEFFHCQLVFGADGVKLSKRNAS